MIFFDKFTIKSKLTFIILGFSLTFIILLLTSIYKINEVVEITKAETGVIKIGGDFYHKIESIKDLKADILPPPLYIIELNEILFELLVTNNKEVIDQKIQWYKSYKNTFFERKDYWYKDLPNDDMKDELLKVAIPIAENIFNVVDEEFLPNFYKGDKEICYSILRNKILPLFYNHKESIEKVAKYTDEKSAQLVDDSKKLEAVIYETIKKSNQETLLLIVFLSGGLFVLFGSLILIISNSLIKNAKNAYIRINQIVNGQITNF